MMCFVKLSLSLLMATAFQVSATSPSKDDFSHNVIPSEISTTEVVMRALLLCKSVVKIIYWGLTASEALHVLSNPQLGCRRIPLAYWVGTALVVAGCLIRVACYRTLGHMFTFTCTVQPDHRLVTHGPYAFVRHPSYIGVMMCVVGIVVAQGSRGSWLRESGMLTTLWGVFAVLVWSWSMGTVCICLIFRMKDEDELLREMFGDEWTRWASRVRYRLVPGIY